MLADALRSCWTRTRAARARASSPRPSTYGTHRFTDAIDSDGHGNGPFHLRLALTRETGRDGEDRFIFDATATDDQSPGPVNFLMNPDVPGMALGAVLPRRRSGARSATPAARRRSTRCACARARCCGRNFPRRSACAASP